MKAKVLMSFRHGRRNPSVGDIIEVDEAKFKELERVGIVKEYKLKRKTKELKIDNETK